MPDRHSGFVPRTSILAGKTCRLGQARATAQSAPLSPPPPIDAREDDGPGRKAEDECRGADSHDVALALVRSGNLGAPEVGEEVLGLLNAMGDGAEEANREGPTTSVGETKKRAGERALRSRCLLVAWLGLTQASGQAGVRTFRLEWGEERGEGREKGWWWGESLDV